MKKLILLGVFSFLVFAQESGVVPDSIRVKPPTPKSQEIVGPSNLSTVNTVNSDFAPYISASGEVLYFSSNTHFRESILMD